MEAIKSSLEQVYTSQMESLRADLAHEKAQALNELRQALMLANDEALKRMEESWAAKLEEERKDLAYRTGKRILFIVLFPFCRFPQTLHTVYDIAIIQYFWQWPRFMSDYVWWLF